MSTTALKAAVTNQKPATVVGMLTDPSFQRQMAMALPKHLSPERLSRIALTEVRRTPALAKCDQQSFAGAVMTCAQLGLEPGGGLGHAYLLPFDNRKKGITECQLIIGYRGMIDLARRSGQIVSLEARVVHQHDHFRVQFGLHSTLEHEPNWSVEDRGPLRFVYAVAKLKDGGVQFEVMSKQEIDKIKAKSKTSSFGPWVDHYEEMAKKTVIRRLFKYLPVSVEMTRAVVLDELADGNISQHSATIDGDFSEIPPERQLEDRSQAAGPSFAMVAEVINTSSTREEFEAAAAMIEQVDDAQQREELMELLKRAEDVATS